MIPVSEILVILLLRFLTTPSQKQCCIIILEHKNQVTISTNSLSHQKTTLKMIKT